MEAEEEVAVVQLKSDSARCGEESASGTANLEDRAV